MLDCDERFEYIIGVDEVGWGAIAGPVCVCAVVVPVDFINPGIKDSKRYTTDNARKRGCDLAKEHVLEYSWEYISPKELKKLGPGRALAGAQSRQAQKLLIKYPTALVVVDGNKRIPGIAKALQRSIPGADDKVTAVSAASIIAKVARDTYMRTEGDSCPEFEFHKNKGYPTSCHTRLLKELGPTEYHRFNIRMVKDAFKDKGWYDKD